MPLPFQPLPDATVGSKGSLAAFAARGALQIRTRFFLWMRLGVRAWEAATAVSLGRDRHGLLVAAAVGCAVLDVGQALLLRRRPRVPLLPRGAVDAVDVAAWSLALGPGSVAPMAAAPISLELGMRYGWRGLSGPLAVGAGAVLLRLLASRPLELSELSLFLWPSVTALVGAVVTRYLWVTLDRQRRLATAETEAAAGQAELAGQHSVAVGADTVVDLLTRTVPLLAADGAAPRPSPLAAWKAALAAASSQQASYLGVVLTRWQRSWNTASPDLGADVELSWAGEVGALRLSPGQVRALSRSLERLELRGRVAVQVARADLPGHRQVLLVGGRQVVVPADPRPTPRPMEIGPTVFVLAMFLILGHSLPTLEAVPLWASGPPAAAAAGLALWSHRHLRGGGAAGYRDMLAAGLALGAVDAVLSTLTMRNPFPDHLAGVPGAVFPAWFAPLFLIYERDLTRAVRLLYLGLAVAIVGLGFALLPAPVPPWQVPVALIWPAAGAMACLGLRDILDREGADLSAELEALHREAVAAALRRGRALVIELAAGAAAQARADFAVSRPQLDPVIAAEAERRLQEVDARLARLREGAAAPAS